MTNARDDSITKLLRLSSHDGEGGGVPTEFTLAHVGRRSFRPRLLMKQTKDLVV
jgi:hypothetical protein